MYSPEHYNDRLKRTREALARHKDCAAEHKADLSILQQYPKDRYVLDGIDSAEYWLKYHERIVVEIEAEIKNLEADLQKVQSA